MAVLLTHHNSLEAGATASSKTCTGCRSATNSDALACPRLTSSTATRSRLALASAAIPAAAPRTEGLSDGGTNLPLLRVGAEGDGLVSQGNRLVQTRMVNIHPGCLEISRSSTRVPAWCASASAPSCPPTGRSRQCLCHLVPSSASLAVRAAATITSSQWQPFGLPQ